MNQQTQDSIKKDSLYFDGTCPLCSKEISLLKKLIKERILFVDIHKVDPNDLNIPPREELLRRLHLRQLNGEWLIGLDANVAVWSHTNYGFLFRILRWPIIRNIADSVYASWADRRFKKRYQCSTCN